MDLQNGTNDQQADDPDEDEDMDEDLDEDMDEIAILKKI